jgi:lysophospholipid acyltransferase (LPLAT)-like uncharacterized protein
VKKFVRRPWVQTLLAWLVSAYLDVTLATMRWRFIDRGLADAAVASPDGLIACFWHGRIALAVVCRRVLKKKPRRVLISRSPDGEFIAKVVRRLSFPAIRGSANRPDAAHDQRSFGASRDVLRFIRDGGVVAITPDGPLGPAEQMPVGPVLLARIADAPVFLFGLAASPTLTLKSWDRTQIPLPFGRGCVVFDGPLAAPRRAEANEVECVRADWQARLRAAQAAAEAALAAR